MRSVPSPRLRALVTSAAMLAGFVTITVAAAPVASAAPGPILQRTPEVATTDILPTPQIDGVAWTQLIIGNTVYVGGNFTTVTPSPSDPVQSSTPRSNLLAYNLTTGDLITTFNVPMNGQVITLAKSPDNSRLYVGGDFTTANGLTHRRLAAINVATGQVIDSWKPNLDARVAAIVATDSTVYAGGALSNANGVARTRFAAFTATGTGTLLAWAPTADAAVKTMLLSPDGTKLFLGGQFQQINGSNVYGLAAVSPADGTLVPWAASGTVRAYGSNSAITALRTDGTAVYGTGYTFGPLPVSNTREFEGTFSADPGTGTADPGKMNWVADCHGDSYDVYSTGTVVYSVSHAHFCENIGAFPQVDPGEYRRALAFTVGATGTINPNTQSGYKNWAGTPSPGMYNWYPDLEIGTFTGQSQAAWSVTGSGPYVVMAGEFPIVNGQPQRGLVRFATRPTSPGRDVPRAQGSNLLAFATSTPAQQPAVTVRWRSSWDRDDLELTYKLVRNSDRANPIWTGKLSSTWWNRPDISFTDTAVTAGATYTYRVYATDSDGNEVQGDLATVTAWPGGTPYFQRAVTDGASLYYRLGEPSGTRIVDQFVSNESVATDTVTRPFPGAIAGDADTSTHFAGSSASMAVGPQTSVSNTGAFTIEGWVRTTSTQGGTIINFGNRNTGSSTSIDRVLYLDNAGHILFGVNSGGAKTVASVATFRDGTWHHVAGTVGTDGMSLYVDGLRVGQRVDVTNGASLTGFWRLGGDSLSGWTSRPSSGYINADLDEVAVYPTALSAQTIAAHATLGGKTVTPPPAPADAYGARVFGDSPELYWRLGEASGTTVTDASIWGSSPGGYLGGVTLNQAGALVGNPNTAAQFNGSNGYVATSSSMTGPSTFTVEAWFKSTSTSGGRILGLGNQRTSNSTSYDRQIYLNNLGRVVFTVGSTANLTSTGAFNNGAWHHVVGTNGPDGMLLYVDGALVGSRAIATPLTLTGYWRAGGDTTGGSTSRFLNGTIDEVAMYYRALPAQQVLLHYQIGTDTTPNTPPVAAFTSSTADLTVNVDGSSSTDPDGSVAGYSWNWGDGSPKGSGATASHSYGTQGTYTVTLTVTDNRGATNSVSHDVTVLAANVSPIADFGATSSLMTASVDGNASHDPDGSIAGYSWNWGDGSPADSGVTASHIYTAEGTFTVTLTVTDNRGATGSVSHDVTAVLPANVDPVAAFTSSANFLDVSVDGSTSADSDGTIASYAWNWGDGSAAGSGATATHRYAAAGTYTVALTVTDNRGGTNTVAHDVTVSEAPNQAPVAAFTSSSALRVLSVNGSGSADADGTVVSYSWNWGDGTPAGAGASTTHTYAADGTYTVTLAVTDDDGAVGTLARQVTVTSAVVADAFGRTAPSGWGSADLGGAWTLSGVASKFAVGGGTGTILMSAAASGPSAALNGVSMRDLDGTVDFAVDKPPTGGGVYTTVSTRRVGTSNYQFTLKYLATGGVTVSIARTDNGTSMSLGSVTVAGLTYVAGDTVRMRFQAIGSGTTTLAVKAWKVGTTEPAAFALTKTDSTASVQGAGSFSVQAYLSASSTNAPVIGTFDNLVIIQP